MATTVKTYGDITHFNESPWQLFEEGVFPAQGVTLAELRRAYADQATGVRQNVHANYGKAEWLADVVDTTGAKARGNILVLNYFQRPEGLTIATIKSTKSGTQNETRHSVDGKSVEYACPPSGWVVPGDGKLWLPELGTAIATVDDRGEAIRQVAAYISKHPKEFAGWDIPKRWHAEFVEKFGRKNFNPENPTPDQLAEMETSYQYRPNANTGLRAVGRFFWDLRNVGPFDVYLDDDVVPGDSDVGARLRSRE